ncbi:sensor histidine kinase [Pandoraea apista]|uniref:sensor histidine kinase n=1 Tax=Pandoraea apista TaxID=93218 RepID=UPI000659BDE1|nr:sensor histidine kinase [Pandoraea apista]ALS67155.1 sensor histidine kinase [Pandoraea apista]RRW97029.1 sensor histidine kinase [Pandoraea apista]RRX00120.1 sensor histidine kinase [Pandoraea apista]CFB60715.1 Sensor-type histidine kinase PrrB [Pandoraea apista]
MIVPGRSLYLRLVVRMGAVLAFAVAAVLLGIWFSTRSAVDRAYDRWLLGSALQVAENTWYQNGEVNVDVPLAAFSALAPGDQIFYTVLDPNGRSVAGDSEFRPVIPWDKLADGPVVVDGTYQEMPIRIAIVGRRMPVAAPHPWAVVALAHTQNARVRFTRGLADNTLLITIATGGLTMLAALWTLRQALLPLKQIEAALRARDSNDLAPLAVTVPAETLALVGAINDFMHRLAASRALMRRVIGDAAHQLRTPVTALTAQAEMLTQTQDETAREIHLARIQKQARGLGGLIHQLINHAMVQHRADSVAPVPVDLNELLQAAMRETLSYATRDIDVALNAPDTPCMILGDPLSLREAIKNVLVNALAYGAPHRLHVDVTSAEDRWRLRFFDDGPGIPEAEWQRVRTPFSSRADGREGASLGLAMVAEVIHAHGGKMGFERVEGEGFAVVLTLPMAAG